MSHENGKSASMSELKEGDQVQTGTKDQLIVQFETTTYVVGGTVMFSLVRVTG